MAIEKGSQPPTPHGTEPLQRLVDAVKAPKRSRRIHVATPVGKLLNAKLSNEHQNFNFATEVAGIDEGIREAYSTPVAGFINGVPITVNQDDFKQL